LLQCFIVPTRQFFERPGYIRTPSPFLLQSAPQIYQRRRLFSQTIQQVSDEEEKQKRIQDQHKEDVTTTPVKHPQHQNTPHNTNDISASTDGNNVQKIRPEECHTVCVRNLPQKITEKQMREFFVQAGEIVSVVLKNNGKSRFGFVKFATGRDTEKAVKLTGKAIEGSTIRVDYSRSNRTKPSAERVEWEVKQREKQRRMKEKSLKKKLGGKRRDPPF
jgi:RNA recognition motif-containing protein